MKLEKLENLVALDKWYAFTLLSLLSVVGIYVNSIAFSSPLLGTPLFSIWLLINSIFLGRVFFEDEGTSFRVVLGSLLLLIFLALSSGLAMFVVALEIFPIIFETKTVVAILILDAIAISSLSHFQMRKASK